VNELAEIAGVAVGGNKNVKNDVWHSRMTSCIASREHIEISSHQRSSMGMALSPSIFSS
jgi:hypothetical protein